MYRTTYALKKYPNCRLLYINPSKININSSSPHTDQSNRLLWQQTVKSRRERPISRHMWSSAEFANVSRKFTCHETFHHRRKTSRQDGPKRSGDLSMRLNLPRLRPLLMATFDNLEQIANFRRSSSPAYEPKV